MYGAMGQCTTGNTSTADGQFANDKQTRQVIGTTAVGCSSNLHNHMIAGFQTAVGYHSLYTCNGGLENASVGANSMALTTDWSRYTIDGKGTNSL